MRLFLTILLPAAILFSCEKFSKAPEIQTVSAQKLENGIKMKAEITSGAKNIKTKGFCFSTTPSPEPTEANIDNGTVKKISPDSDFSATISDYNFESYTGYYIRPYVVSKAGKYIYGNEVYFENIQPPLITVPCTHEANSINSGASTNTEYFTEISVEKGMGKSTILAKSDSYELKIEFDEIPKTGIYTINSNSSALWKYVAVEFKAGLLDPQIVKWNKIYGRTDRKSVV